MQNYQVNDFAPGTFIPAFTAKTDVILPVPVSLGGLSDDENYSVRGITFATNNTFYVADEGHNRVLLFDSISGKLIDVIANKHTMQPDQIIYNKNNNCIYIASPGSNRIQVYNPTTQQLTTFIHDADHLSHVSGIAFGEDGNFYAADRTTKTIYQYDANGNFIKTFAGPFSDSPEGIMTVTTTDS